MSVRLTGGARTGLCQAPPSKSYLHRYLLLAAAGEKPVELQASPLPEDAWVTAHALGLLGAQIESTETGGLRILPLSRDFSEREMPLLPCGGSGSSLRFLLPFVGTLGLKCALQREESLVKRPWKELGTVLSEHGMTVREAGSYILAEGLLEPGEYRIRGDISSQYISGLLMSLPLLDGSSRLTAEGPLRSGSYLLMTEQCLREAGLRFEKEETEEKLVYHIPGGQRPALPDTVIPEGDWSGAAFFLGLGALSRSGIRISGLRQDSLQGDRAILGFLREMGAELHTETDGEILSVRAAGSLRGITADVRNCPDLFPILAVLGACASGCTRLIGGESLRTKESDRIAASAELLRAVGCEAEELPDGLEIRGGMPLRGGKVGCRADHRMAMAAAVLASALPSEEALEPDDVFCVTKSYPGFWRAYKELSYGSLDR